MADDVSNSLKEPTITPPNLPVASVTKATEVCSESSTPMTPVKSVSNVLSEQKLDQTTATALSSSMATVVISMGEEKVETSAAVSATAAASSVTLDPSRASLFLFCMKKSIGLFYMYTTASSPFLPVSFNPLTRSTAVGCVPSGVSGLDRFPCRWPTVIYSYQTSLYQ